MPALFKAILLMVLLICPWSEKYQNGVAISERGSGSADTSALRYRLSAALNQIELQKFLALIQNYSEKAMVNYMQ